MIAGIASTGSLVQSCGSKPNAVRAELMIPSGWMNISRQTSAPATQEITTGR